MSDALNTIEGFSLASQNICVLVAAAELDLFTPMTHTPMTALALSERCQTDLRATVTLLDALAALGILDKQDSEEPLYSVQEAYCERLNSRHPKTYIPMLRHRANCIRKWMDLARILRSGQPQKTAPSILGAEEDYRSFVLAMHAIGINLVGGVVDALEQAGCLTFSHLLDVGGASGTYTLEMLKRRPQAQATIFDLPPAIEEARKRMAGTEYEPRVRLVAGNFDVDNLPAGSDFAWVSAIIHQFDRNHARALYRNIHRALEPGGTIAVRDFVMQPGRTRPFDGAMFAINMLTATPNGMCYTYDEIRGDLEAAGFTHVRYAVPSDTMSAIVTAVKLPNA